MNLNQRKISNISKTMALVFKIAGIVTGIISVLAIGAICILAFPNGEIKQSFIAAFEVTANNGTVISIASNSLLVMFFFMLINTSLMTIIIVFIYDIFCSIGKSCTPFTIKVTKRIKQIAIISIALSLIGGFSDALVDYYTIGELTWRIDFIGLLSSMVILCLALIFRYGCDLQQQSDETL